MRSVDEQLAAWGVEGSGPYATELRAKLLAERAKGLVHGGGSFGPEYYRMDSEARAKEWLSNIWTLERGHFYQISGIDPAFGWAYDMSDTVKYPLGRRYLRVDWRAIPSRVGDLFRRWAMEWRVFRDLYILRIRNPYLS